VATAKMGLNQLDAYVVEVDVYATKMRQNKVTDGVCALDGELVVIKGFKEPRISSDGC
jgi:hypothetical protein